jgi:hypothetical protein
MGASIALTQALHPAEFTPRPPSGLDGQHQRNRLGFGGFVQLRRLFDAIVSMTKSVACRP